MYLLPSSVQFLTSCIAQKRLQDIAKPENIIDASRRISKHAGYPKLQVVQKDGHYFTLNNTSLQIFRYLEDNGTCSKVKVDQIALSAVPEGIRLMMVAPAHPPTDTQTDSSRSTAKGYAKVKQRDSSRPVDPDSDEDTPVDVSECEESDIQNSDSDDWSDEDTCSSGPDSNSENVEVKVGLLQEQFIQMNSN